MHRRAFLTASIAAGGALAGCVAGRVEPPEGGGRSGTAGSPGLSPDRLPVDDVELRVGTGRDVIPAIVDPAFGTDWSGIELDATTLDGPKTIQPRLAGDDLVVGVERDGDARAYPLRLLNWHEVVNDAFAGPLLVTYCPLCRSAAVADRTVRGTPTTFGVSGLLWRDNLVLYDRLTGSLWSQVAATAIQGPATGTRLSLAPSSLTTWDRWRDAHGGTSVLLPPPLSGTIGEGEKTRDYTINPYGGYEGSGRTGLYQPSVPNEENAGDYVELTGHHPKTLVLGIEHDGVARAYPLDAVRRAEVVNDTVGGLPVVVTAVDESLAGYVRRVDGTVVEFSPDGPAHLLGGGSRWRRRDGTAVSGPHEGARLDSATGTSPLFWFAWRSLNPETTVYGDG